MSQALPHPGADSACQSCKGSSYVVQRKGEFATASLCSCVQPCPICKDTGWIADGDEWRARRKRCTCASISRRIDVYNNAHIPGRHADSTFERFEQHHNQGLTRAWMGARSAVTTYQRDEVNRGLVFHGPVGTGKTHLMCAVLRELVFQHGITVRFVEFSHLLSDLKASFDNRSGSSNVLKELVEVEVLAIDELGKGKVTDWEITVLDELISRRYNGLSTVFGTSNYGPTRTGIVHPNFVTGAMPGLPDRVDDRIISRLHELCDFQEMPGQDWRRRRSAPGLPSRR